MPLSGRVPPLPFLPASTACSAWHFSGLLHPDTDHGVRHVAGSGSVSRFARPLAAEACRWSCPATASPGGSAPDWRFGVILLAPESFRGRPRCLEARSVSLCLSLWRSTLRSFPLHGSCTASAGLSGRVPRVVAFPANRVCLVALDVGRPSSPGHRGRYPLVVARCDACLAVAPRERGAGVVGSAGCSTSGSWSAVKSVATAGRCRLAAARCSLGLCPSKVCVLRSGVSMPPLSPAEAVDDRAPKRAACGVGVERGRSPRPKPVSPANRFGGVVHSPRPPLSSDLPAASRWDFADPTGALSRRSAHPEGLARAPHPVACPLRWMRGDLRSACRFGLPVRRSPEAGRGTPWRTRGPFAAPVPFVRPEGCSAGTAGLPVLPGARCRGPSAEASGCLRGAPPAAAAGRSAVVWAGRVPDAVQRFPEPLTTGTGRRSGARAPSRSLVLAGGGRPKPVHLGVPRGARRRSESRPRCRTGRRWAMACPLPRCAG